MSAACGRADLVRALAAGGPAGLDAAARLLGYQPTPAPKDRQDMRLDQRPLAEPPLPLDPAPSAPSAPSEQLEVSFWQPIARWFLDETAGEEPSEDAATPAGASARRVPVAWSGRPATPPSWPSLEPWRRLLPRLRGHIAEWSDGGELDVDAAIPGIAQAQELKRLPRRKRRRWGPAIQVIDDRSRRLTPFWRDQDQVCAWLAALYPRDRFDHARWFDGAHAPIRHVGLDIDADYRPPPPGTAVLVLGDLGVLAQDRRCVRLWLEFGRRLRAAGCVPVALTPCPSARWPKPLRRVWRLVEWERRTARADDGARDIPAERAMTERLLRLLSPAIRVEPGLLRSVRRALLPDADAGVEADFWQDKALASHSSVAATLDPDAAVPLRQAFEAEDAGVRRLVLDLLRGWRFGLSADVWFEEIVSLGADSRALLPEAELTEAADRFDQLSRWAPTITDPLMRAEMVHSLRGLFDRLPSAIDADARVGAAMGRLRRMTKPEAGPEAGPPRPVQLRQIGDDLLAVAGEEAGPTGSPVAQVWTTDGRIAVSQELAVARNAFWKTGKPPPWALDWGWDEFGAWATFKVRNVVQRLRWIPPGRFLMGSPGNEEGRDGDEGLQHEVTLIRGYWLFDTACTQALWWAVMGSNPSYFMDDRCPVDSVSWNDVQGFLTRLNARVPGLELGLPTEVQWEHACRAGTTTPFSFGSDITPEQVNYDGNYPYADGSKGLFRRGTVPVASLPPNAWGLYEMHGNVWEWCADGQRYNTMRPATGPRAPESADAKRVLRGGSWLNTARYARAACRYWIPRMPAATTLAFGAPEFRPGVTPARRMQRSRRPRRCPGWRSAGERRGRRAERSCAWPRGPAAAPAAHGPRPRLSASARIGRNCASNGSSGPLGPTRWAVTVSACGRRLRWSRRAAASPSPNVCAGSAGPFPDGIARR